MLADESGFEVGVVDAIECYNLVSWDDLLTCPIRIFNCREVFSELWHELHWLLQLFSLVLSSVSFSRSVLLTLIMRCMMNRQRSSSDCMEGKDQFAYISSTFLTDLLFWTQCTWLSTRGRQSGFIMKMSSQKTSLNDSGFVKVSEMCFCLDLSALPMMSE